MKLEQFAMERMQSTYENLVEFNLSESGVRPLSARELIEDPEGLDGLLDQPLVYSQSNGTIELRESIARLYPGASIDHVEVTNGGSEANFIATLRLVDAGDEVVMLVPTYMQTWGLSRAFGGVIREWKLVEDHAAFRHVMRVLLAREPNLEMVAQAESLDEARQHCTSVEFDVVVLDLSLPDGNGADLIVDVREANPAVGVLILSASLDPTSLQRVTLAGADEILDKLASPTEIAGAIRHLGSA